MRLLLLIFLLGVAAGPAAAETIHRSHAIALHGEPKYGPDFRHFDYVNPAAPVGGTLRLGVDGTFDSFNPFIIRGNAFGDVGYETLTVASADEPFTRYGLIAESIEWPEDRSWVIYRIRPEARWRDGQPITAHDVVFSLETLTTKGAPFYRFYYGTVARAEALDEHTVRFEFTEAGNRELPLIVGEIPILPKHYWADRDFERTSLEPPLTSGPYRIGDFEPGRYVTMERDPDYWGWHLPVNVGENNFARIRYEYFRDATVLRQALKGGVIDFREENQAKAWATDYDVPAVANGWLIMETIPVTRTEGMQGFVFNTRRALFQDRRVREALGYAFDFEWTNPALFFGQYTRSENHFANSELASSGLPTGEELAILERYRGRVPDEVFTEEFRAPVTDGSGWPRENLARAFELLAEAGWVVRDMKLVNAETGEPMRFEIMLVSAAFERVVLPFVHNLRRLGIDVRVRLVDQSQYINRLRSFDFDMIVFKWGQSDSPGNEQRGYWSSASADAPGARNFAGVADPVVDELVELVIFAPDRESLVHRVRALDRVLLWGFYVIPHWHLTYQRILYWNKFSRPEVTPRQGTSTTFWWYDAVKAERLERRLAVEGTSEQPRASSSQGRTVLISAVLLFGLGFIAFRLLVRRSAG
jgi:microcin C transport system substrate-binding protein